jgi:hypothetical protein
MPKIIWVGNKPWGTGISRMPDAPRSKADRPAGEYFQSLPSLRRSSPAAVIRVHFHQMAPYRRQGRDPVFMPAGIALGLLLIPVHELLHALCCPAGSTAYVGDIGR